MADTERIVTCPACDKEMTKVYMEEAGVNVDICLNGCGGILFNNRELEKFDEQHENADNIFAALENKTFEPVNEEEVRVCTICDTPMVKQGAGVSDVEIDVCNVCGAKFLDYGELEKIREQNASNHEFTSKINAQVDAMTEEHRVRTGGAIGSFAQKHVRQTHMRDAFEDFVNFLLRNK